MKKVTPVTAAPTESTHLVERTDLPRIFVRGKSQNRYYAHVTAYVIGPRTRIKSVDVYPLYYLSLVAMHGEGNILQGLWSSLIANTPQEIYLENVGLVVLATPVHSNLGYTLHWNYHQTTLATQDLHAVVESHMLTFWDPILGMALVERERKQKRAQGKRKARASTIALSTLAKKDQGDMQEETDRQLFPLFLLLVPGSEQPKRGNNEGEGEYVARNKMQLDTYRTAQHFAFLNQRVPWPLLPAWADFLWERGVEREEITPLTIWSIASKQTRNEDDDEGGMLPLFVEAWLCQPNPTLLPADLKQARTHGRLLLPVTTHSTPEELVVMASR